MSANPQLKKSHSEPLNYWATVSSYGLVGLLCALAIWKGLLPGLLAVCLGFGATRWLSKHRQGWRNQLTPGIAATLVIAAPVLFVAWVSFQAKGWTLLAVDQYQELLQHMSNTVLDIRSKLPEDLASQLPEGVTAIQEWVADHLKDQARAMASVGKSWLHGALMAFVGLVVGALLAATPRNPAPRPLASALRKRATHFMSSFTQIVNAQLWIAGLNAVLTAVFLLGALPAFSVEMPYAYALVGFTFVAGLIPIVGNLLCNVVLTLVGVSVSVTVGLACLLFLIAIHKFEYFINAKVVGSQTKTAAWELLAALFAAEALFGVPGLVAAPLYYAYLKRELSEAGLV